MKTTERIRTCLSYEGQVKKRKRDSIWGNRVRAKSDAGFAFGGYNCLNEV